MRHVLRISNLSTQEVERIFSLADNLKDKLRRGLREPLLPGRVMALLFEKPSLRARVSFQTCMAHLGGGSLFLGEEVGFTTREAIPDFARVLGQYVDIIVCRCKYHHTIEELARFAPCPVVNGLSDEAHPCQAMADVYTLRELVGDLHGLTMAYIGDVNNVARSLVEACGRMGMRLAIAAPARYMLRSLAFELHRHTPSVDIEWTPDPRQAVRNAVAVYTDVWTSMGQEAESATRRNAFAEYQVNEGLMACAPKDAVFMHCLPAHRGEEVTDDVIDGPRSLVLQQAANRMHVQKALLLWLLTGVTKRGAHTSTTASSRRKRETLGCL